MNRRTCRWKRTCLFGVLFLLVLSFLIAAVVCFFILLSHSLSELDPYDISLIGLDLQVVVVLKTLTGGFVKRLSLSASPPSEDVTLNIMDVYLLPIISTNWTNITVPTQLDSHPLSPFYALEGSVVIFNVTQVYNGGPITLQLLADNDSTYCQKIYPETTGNIIHECIINKSGFYRVSFNGNGTAVAMVTYNTKGIDLNGVEPYCQLNQLTNCSLPLTFVKRSYLILNYRQYYSYFTVHVDQDPRTELYCFVLLFITVLIPLVVCAIILWHQINKLK